ncbi:hypothetical protein [Prosthecobacter fusiformis]|nr:hypothetical protein [Prosthecobacter fusiformis]
MNHPFFSSSPWAIVTSLLLTLLPHSVQGQADASAALNVPKLDPAKWVRLEAPKDFREKEFTIQPDGSFKVRYAYTNATNFRDVAVRSFMTMYKDRAAQLTVRNVAGGGRDYQVRILNDTVSIIKYTPLRQPYDGESKVIVLAEFQADTKKIHSTGEMVTLAATGNTLTVWLGDKCIGSAKDDEYKEGRIGLSGSGTIFKFYEYQLLDGSTVPVTVAPAPQAAYTGPAASTLPLPPEAAALRTQYEALMGERVTGIYDAEVSKLNSGYLAGLDRASASAQSAGQLDTVLAIQDEMKWIGDKKSLPTTDDAKTPEALKSLRGIYRTSLAKLDEQRSKSHTALLTPYKTRLQQMEAELTKAGRIPDAVSVKQYREAVAAPSASAAP